MVIGEALELTASGDVGAVWAAFKAAARRRRKNIALGIAPLGIAGNYTEQPAALFMVGN